MTQFIKKESQKELLKDYRFILWVLSPNEELDTFWKHYIQCYPEEKETLEKAKADFKKIKLNAFQLSDIEKRRLIQSVKRKAAAQKRIRLRRQVWKYAAACIFILGIGISFWLSQTNFSFPQNESNLITSAVLEDNQTEIELLTQTQKIQLSNNTEIRVNKIGNVEIPEEDIQLIEEQIIPEEDLPGKVPMNILKVPEGRRSFLTLPDGTKAWINSGTIFQFPEQFNAKERIVYVEGEIYLEVNKDPSRPFLVKTSQMDIQVLGTSFCVSAYNDVDNQSVILREGSVSVNNRIGGKQQIHPNEMLVLANNQMKVKQVNAYDYISWIDGFLQFNQRDLESILAQLARYYRVKIICSDNLKTLKCSGKLVLFDDVEHVLNTLQTTLSISYVKEGDQILIK